jgi:protein TonB
MSLPQYGRESSWGHIIAIPTSILFHMGLALLMLNAPVEEKREEVWIEMEIIEEEAPPEKPVELEVEKEPEPETPKPKPKPKPKRIDSKDIPPDPEEAPPEPPPEKKKQVRRVQGLKASSFAEGGQTGLNVRAGTTLQTSAGNETLSIKEASESTAISYAAATTQPRLKKRPPLEVPQSVIDNGIEGTVQIVISINADGSVSDAKVTKKLHPDADHACLKSWKQAKFKPAKQGDAPVSITNFPRRCRFKAMD